MTIYASNLTQRDDGEWESLILADSASELSGALTHMGKKPAPEGVHEITVPPVIYANLLLFGAVPVSVPTAGLMRLRYQKEGAYGLPSEVEAWCRGYSDKAA